MLGNSLKIRHFGPIGEGYADNDGYLPINKITILCGPQAVGKSCIAKLYATFSWLAPHTIWPLSSKMAAPTRNLLYGE